MRAIDLYAGIGGWSLGLRLAGVDVVASYEWWQPAINTHNGNHGGALSVTDIRKLDLESLPSDIDLVVGSPPCTEFSYANRGGKGDLAEGLKDIVRFFEIVSHLKPRYWAMENVPRVARVLEEGFYDPEHPLFRFNRLAPQIRVIDFSEYGTPQSRNRCIATNIPLDRLSELSKQTQRRTLGDVLTALRHQGTVSDPVWGIRLPAASVTELETEQPLNLEELRMNREAKEFHPVYNNMAFPDPLDQPARTVTATCTRVSRESIVVADDPSNKRFRRLSIRERASLQGFPITYQFYAKTFAEKAKMIGNAIPPTFTYLLALAAKGGAVPEGNAFSAAAAELALPPIAAPKTAPDREGRTYPWQRSFRAALPSLRFKSGMRFDLSNAIMGDQALWKVRFFFGPSKDIQEVPLDGTVTRRLAKSAVVAGLISDFQGKLAKVEQRLAGTSPNELQQVWAHRSTGTSPYDIVDNLGALAAELHGSLLDHLGDCANEELVNLVLGVAQAASRGPVLPNRSKLEKNATLIVVGLLVGEWFNCLDWHGQRLKAA